MVLQCTQRADTCCRFVMAPAKMLPKRVEEYFKEFLPEESFAATKS